MQRLINIWWQSGDSRAASELIGYLLVLVIVIGGVVTILALGSVSINDLSQQFETDQVENTITLFDSRTAMVALGNSRRQSIPLSNSGGSYQISDSNGWIRVTVNETGSKDPETVANVTLGSVRYENGDTVIAYQGGGVWRKDEDHNSRMSSPPEFHYKDATLTLPIIAVDGSGSVSKGRISIERNGTTKQVFPNLSADNVNPVQNGDVNVTVKSEFYTGWANYFDKRTEGTTSVNDSRNTATIQLTVPSDRPSVQGGIVSGNRGSELEVENNAEADSYNSSVGRYMTSSDDSTYILTAGDAIAYQNAVIKGDLEVSGSMTVKNNAEIRGNISYGLGLSKKKNAVIDGWTNSNASVQTPSSVERQINGKLMTLQKSNDNSKHSSTISNMETEQCSSSCTLTAGKYYINGIDMEDDLTLDTTSGNITLAVDGDIDIGNGALWDVTGNKRVNIYTNGDLDLDNNAEIAVPGDRSTNFWIYMKPGTSADIQKTIVDGVIYGPGSTTENGVDIDVANNAHVYGSVVGDIDNLDQNYNIHYDTALSSEKVITNSDNRPILSYMHISINRVKISTQD